MTHTPGPWQIGGELISQKGTNKEIASVWAHSANRKFSPRQSEADANARIMAAAPEMLEALQVLAEWPRKSITVDGEWLNYSTVELANIRRFAREAFAKATG